MNLSICDLSAYPREELVELETKDKFALMIALSANAYDEDIKQSLAAGMNAHPAKPIEVQTMIPTLERMIASVQPYEESGTQENR